MVSSISLQSRVVSLYQLESAFPGGNKFFKLQHNLRQAKVEGYNRLLTFGGAWSNHIHALSEVGRQSGFETIGIIRGERPEKLSATLEDAEARGMQLKFISRTQYRLKHEAGFIDSLAREFGPFYLLPEGGTNALAVSGCQEILKSIDSTQYDLICLPVGTGGTMAGIVSSLAKRQTSVKKPPDQTVMGVSVMKGNRSLDATVGALIDEALAGSYKTTASATWQINHDYHCGGYAKCPPYLMDFIRAFESEQGVQLDPVYTGKLLYAIDRMMFKGELGQFKSILVIHTGGSQGRRGFSI